MTSQLPISVCMIVLNEADRLPRTLASLGDVAAEIVVVDTGSTDSTVAVCREFGCRVEEREWLGFSAMRQAVFALASSPWIFWLDADEVLTDEFQRGLVSRFEASLDGVSGFEVNRMVCMDGRWVRHGDWFPDWNLRLFRSSGWRMSDRLVHESVSVEGRVERLPGLLEHHSFRDWSDLARRSDRYARLWAEQERAAGRGTAPLVPSLRAAARFVRGYVLRGGFLDGGLGLRVALANASEVRRKHGLLRSSSEGNP